MADGGKTMHFVLLFCIVAAGSVFASLLFRSRAALCFVPGALVSALLTLLDEQSFITFGALPAFLLLLAATVLCFVLYAVVVHCASARRRDALSTLDMIGTRCVVTEEIDNVAGSGQAKSKNRFFAARALDEDCVIPVGTVVTVITVEGVRLVCKEA